MKENVFDVLMYLFETFMDEDQAALPDRDSLHLELMEVGFSSGEIDQALAWLEDLARLRDAGLAGVAESASVRVYAEPELARLDAECRGFLTFLEQTGVLSPRSREVVIDRAMALDDEDFDLERLKWLILLVLFNQPGEEAAYAWMEDLVYDAVPQNLH